MKYLDFNIALKSINPQKQTTRPKVFTNDLDSVMIRVTITDMTDTDLLGSSAEMLLYMQDRSFFQNSDVTRDGNVFKYLLKENEGNHAGIARFQLPVTTADGKTYAQQKLEFEIESGLETKVATEVMIHDWTTLTREARAYIDEFKLIVNDAKEQVQANIVETAVEEKFNNLEQEYAEDLTQVKSHLAETANEIISSKKEIDSQKRGAVEKSLYDYHNNTSTKEVVVDNFETLGYAETGQEWNVYEGGFRTVEGGLQGTMSGVWNRMWIETGLKDKEIEFNVRSLDTFPRIVFRYEDADNYSFYGDRSSGVASDRVIRSTIDGNVGARVITMSDNKPAFVRLKIIGNTIKLFLNGVSRMTVEFNDDFKDSTKVAIFMYGDTGTISQFRIKELPKIKYPHNIIASVDNMLVAYDGSNLIYSDNGGRNFMKGLNISSIGILKYIHLFSNGNVLFADDTKCYYSSDWKTYQESTLLNEDGTPFTATVNGTFYSHKRPSCKQIVNEKEMIVWGNYSIESGVQRTSNIKAWYTIDYGATVKCAYTANTPSTVSCRHIHNIDYYQTGNYFILQTGDEPSDGIDMSHWVKGIYDDITDTWSWQTIGSGLDFKTTNIVFHDDGYAYYSWDLQPGGVGKVPITTLSDASTHELLFNTPGDCGYVLVGESGDILVFQTSAYNAKVYYYSKDQIEFHLIVGEYPEVYDVETAAQYNNIWPPNSKGKILAGIQSMIDYPSPINYFTRKEGHVWIDEQLNKFGFPNALK